MCILIYWVFLLAGCPLHVQMIIHKFCCWWQIKCSCHLMKKCEQPGVGGSRPWCVWDTRASFFLLSKRNQSASPRVDFVSWCFFFILFFLSVCNIPSSVWVIFTCEKIYKPLFQVTSNSVCGKITCSCLYLSNHISSVRGNSCEIKAIES